MRKITDILLTEEEIALDVDTTETDTKPVGDQNPKQVDDTTPIKASGGEKTPDSIEDPSLIKDKDSGDVTTIANGPQDAPEKSTSETKGVPAMQTESKKVKEREEDKSILDGGDSGDVDKKPVGNQDPKEANAPGVTEPLKAETDKTVEDFKKNIKFVIYENLPRIVLKETDENVELLYDADTKETKEVKKDECKEYVVKEEEESKEDEEEYNIEEEGTEIEADDDTKIDENTIKKGQKILVLKEGSKVKKFHTVEEEVEVGNKILEKGDRYIVLKLKEEDEESKEKEDDKDDKKEDSKEKVKEELTDKQKQLDVDGDGKIEGEDLAKLRAGKKEESKIKESDTFKEAQDVEAGYQDGYNRKPKKSGQSSDYNNGYDEGKKDAGMEEKVLYVNGRKYILQEWDKPEFTPFKNAKINDINSNASTNEIAIFTDKGKINVMRTETGELSYQFDYNLNESNEKIAPEGDSKEDKEDKVTEEETPSQDKPEDDKPAVQEAEGDEKDNAEDKAEDEKKEESVKKDNRISIEEDVEIITEQGKIILEKGDCIEVLSEEDIGTAPLDKAEAEMWKDPVEVKEEMLDVPEKIKEEDETEPKETPEDIKEEGVDPNETNPEGMGDGNEDDKDNAVKAVQEKKDKKVK